MRPRGSPVAFGPTYSQNVLDVVRIAGDEGDDPTGFVSQIKAEFGFSPALDSAWGVKIHADDFCFTSYRFRCPAEHLDAIYSRDRFPMGS